MCVTKTGRQRGDGPLGIAVMFAHFHHIGELPASTKHLKTAINVDQGTAAVLLKNKKAYIGKQAQKNSKASERNWSSLLADWTLRGLWCRKKQRQQA